MSLFVIMLFDFIFEYITKIIIVGKSCGAGLATIGLAGAGVGVGVGILFNLNLIYNFVNFYIKKLKKKHLSFSFALFGVEVETNFLFYIFCFFIIILLIFVILHSFVTIQDNFTKLRNSIQNIIYMLNKKGLYILLQPFLNIAWFVFYYITDRTFNIISYSIILIVLTNALLRILTICYPQNMLFFILNDPYISILIAILLNIYMGFRFMLSIGKLIAGNIVFMEFPEDPDSTNTQNNPQNSNNKPKNITEQKYWASTIRAHTRQHTFNNRMWITSIIGISLTLAFGVIGVSRNNNYDKIKAERDYYKAKAETSHKGQLNAETRLAEEQAKQACSKIQENNKET